jgi:hypothetical protein
MSVYISAAVWRESKASGSTLNVLLSLADQADDGGTCWPSIDNIAKRSRVSRRSVFRHLETLRNLGELTWVNREAEHLPNLYTVLMGQCQSDTGASAVDDTRPVPDVTPPSASGDTGASATAGTINITKKHQDKRSSSTDVDDAFAEFWRAYPKKVSKGQAAKNWRTAVKKVKPETIIEAAQRFAAQCNGTDREFIPHPGSWLTGERWADEEPAPTTRGRPAPSVPLYRETEAPDPDTLPWKAAT